jgi:transcriptional regulator with XRE-family HTH domain
MSAITTIQPRKPAHRLSKQLQDSTVSGEPTPNSIDVGHQLRELRTGRGLSIRALAEASGLNVNTLSLIENGKTSPSVSTLQQLAMALGVPITAFFESDPPQKRIVFQKTGQRRRAAFSHGTLEDLAAGLTLPEGQLLLVTLEPGADSGSTPIVHTGHEFVFCLEGCLAYTIQDQNFTLEPGDSLIFEAHLPHRWCNPCEIMMRSLLVLYPADENDRPAVRHFIRLVDFEDDRSLVVQECLCATNHHRPLAGRPDLCGYYFTAYILHPCPEPPHDAGGLPRAPAYCTWRQWFCLCDAPALRLLPQAPTARSRSGP